jgi:PAS domain S-box-containing protein
MESNGGRDASPDRRRAAQSERPGSLLNDGAAARYFEAAVRQSAVAIIVTDLEHRIRVWNTGAERLLGYRADEVVGEPHELIVPSDLAESDEKMIGDRVADSEQILFFATQRIAKDGRRIPVEVCRSVVLDRDGIPMGFSFVVLDQTEKRAMQERILQAERMNALARVVGKVFHELRTPLGVLVLQSDLLFEEIDVLLDLAGEDIDPALSRRVQESLQIFTREIQRIEGLAEDYLLMIRPIKAFPSALRLGDFVETIRSELTSKSHRAGYDVRVECANPDATVRLDPLQILRIFHNLAGNSLDAIPEDATPILVLRADVEGDRLILTLRDNGPGLPPGLRDGGAFEIFATTKRSGSGLGLHLVQEIVSAHAGRIELRNHAQGGAEAVLTLPVQGPVPDA